MCVCCVEKFHTKKITKKFSQKISSAFVRSVLEKIHFQQCDLLSKLHGDPDSKFIGGWGRRCYLNLPPERKLKQMSYVCGTGSVIPGEETTQSKCPAMCCTGSPCLGWDSATGAQWPVKSRRRWSHAHSFTAPV